MQARLKAEYDRMEEKLRSMEARLKGGQTLDDQARTDRSARALNGSVAR
jgi:predicted  nucleic acid-binding Zn-ribbon protein